MTMGSGGIVWQWRQAVAARVGLAAALETSKQNEDEALRSEDLARHLAYAAKLTLAERDWQDANVAQVRRQLDETRPPPRKTDLRGFEWYYLDRLTRSQGQTLTGHRGQGHLERGLQPRRPTAGLGRRRSDHQALGHHHRPGHPHARRQPIMSSRSLSTRAAPDWPRPGAIRRGAIGR